MQGVYICAVGSHMMEEPGLYWGDHWDRSIRQEGKRKEEGKAIQRGRVAQA